MRRRILLALVLSFVTAPAYAFDQTYAAWTQLLHAHVRVIDSGDASRVDYAGLVHDRAKLDAFTASLSAVPAAQFKAWSRAGREAFLINAYNAFTVQLILSRYPNLTSIKDIGGWFKSPWKIDFFTLLGHRTHLDALEDRLRKPGAYDDPRIHFAINCASIDCPMLRPEAYVASRLDTQLDDQARRFLSDHRRNRYDPDSHTLQVSKIFDWYRSDFSHGWHGITSVRQFLASHAALLTNDPQVQARIRAQQVPVTFLSYNWRLNDVAR